MKNENLLTPLFRTIDKIIFGFEEIQEIEKEDHFIQSDNDEEFDVVRSTN